MANHISAKKRHLQSEKKKVRNRKVKSLIKGHVKKAREAISNKTAQVGQGELQTAQSTLAIAARKGTLNKKTAARRTSRLMKQAAKLQA